jgi:hypothetical protein
LKTPKLKTVLPFIATVIVVLATALQLRWLGRSWICNCGHFSFWISHAWSSETSQHLFDPYSLTHTLHGLAFYGMLALLIPRLSVRWRFWLAILIESVWEVIENTNFVIQRYREATAALGYEGDSVVNSLGDIAACGVGFWLASKLGLRLSLAAFVLIEVGLLITIRDSLLLNIVMLIYPIEALRIWQAGG